MLSAVDSQLVERDREIPGLAVLLDPPRLVTALKSSSSALEPDAAELTYLRYAPGVSCLAGYRLECDGRAVEAYAKAWRPDAPKEPRRPSAVHVRIEPAVSVCVFPHDHRLKSLPRCSTITR